LIPPVLFPGRGKNPAVKKSQHKTPLSFFYPAPPFSGLVSARHREFCAYKKRNIFLLIDILIKVKATNSNTGFPHECFGILGIATEYAGPKKKRHSTTESHGSTKNTA
jgi:hypothetical protein